MNDEKEKYLKLAKEILGEGKSIDEIIAAARKIENYFRDRIDINRDNIPLPEPAMPIFPKYPGIGINPWPSDPRDSGKNPDPYKAPIIMFNKTTAYEI